MIAWSDVVNIAPELATIATNAQTAILSDVYNEMNADVWGSKLDIGAKWLAAHLATVGPRRKGAGGPIMSQTVAQVSQSYGTTAAALSSLGATSYGQEYERLIYTLPSARIMLADCD